MRGYKSSDFVSFVSLLLHPPKGLPIQSPCISFRATLISATTSALLRSAVVKNRSDSNQPSTHNHEFTDG
jgi:hypothetical protein